MTESNQRLLKQTKRFTLILAIIYTVYSVLYIFILAGAFLAKSMDWTEAGLSAEEIATINETMSSSEVYWIYFYAVAYIVLCVFMYIFNSKLKKGKIVSKIPYYFLAAIQVLNIIDHIISQTVTIWNLITNIVIALLAVLAIFNLFKLDSASEK